MRTAAWLAAALLGALLLAQSGFDATEAETAVPLSRALRSGRLSVAEAPFGPWVEGPDGRWYLAHDLLAPLLAVPAVALADLGPVPPGVPRDRWVRALEASTGALVGAVVGLLLFLLAVRRFGLRPDRALVAATLGVFGSLVLPYARTNYDGELAGALLLGALYAGLGDRRRDALVAGLLLGLACLARASTLAAAVPLSLVLGWRGLGRASGTRWALVALGAAPAGLVLLALNHVRTGQALLSPVMLPQFAGNNALVAPFAQGFFGNLVSPGKGLLVHAPLAVLGLWGLARARRWRVFSAALAALVALALVHAKVRNWSGHWAWGPRYLLPAVPLLLAGVGEWLDTRRQRVVLACVAVPSVVVALLPVLVFWSARIAAAGVGNQDAAFGFGGNQIGDAFLTVTSWARGGCPAMSSVVGATCVPDVWWLGWSKTYGVSWPLWVAGLLAAATGLAFARAVRSARDTVAGGSARRGHPAGF